jgi:hypothetical protein
MLTLPVAYDRGHCEKGFAMFAKALFTAAGLCLAATSANAVTYGGFFTGANENPDVISAGKGYGTVQITGNSMKVDFKFFTLGTGLVDAHIHCCTPTTGNTGVAIGFGSLPLGSTSGTWSGTYDLTQSVYRAAFLNNAPGDGTIATARTRLLTGLSSGQAYLNLHTTGFPGGEIRANLALVPEPASWAMMVVGFGLVGGAIHRRNTALAAA